jgi:hypothetical protein
LLHTIITGLLRQYHPDDVELWLADFKMGEFSQYINPMPPHIKYILLDESAELVYDFVELLTKELLRRKQYFSLHPELKKLEAVRIVERIVPILNEKNKKLAQYTLLDGMLRFWFRFVSKAAMAIERGFGEQYYDNNVKEHIHDYMGLVFETICQEYVFRKGITGEYGSTLTLIGKWRGNDPVRKCPADIDVVGIDAAGKTAVIGECKYKNSAFGKEEYEVLLDRGRLIRPYTVKKYLIFALSGVTKWVSEQQDPEVEIVSMSKLFDLEHN